MAALRRKIWQRLNVKSRKCEDGRQEKDYIHADFHRLEKHEERREQFYPDNAAYVQSTCRRFLENAIVPPVRNWMGLVTMSDYFALRAHTHKALR